MSGSRKQVLSDAIKAEIGAAPADRKTLFTDDVTGLVAGRHRVGAAGGPPWPLFVKKRSPTS